MTAVLQRPDRDKTAAKVQFSGLAPPPGCPLPVSGSPIGARRRDSLVRPIRIRELYPKMDVTGRAGVDGTDAVTVTGTTTRGAAHTLFFDETSGLLLRRYSERPTPLGQLLEEFDFGDYREANGVQVPHMIRWSRADYRVVFVVKSVR